MTTDGPWCVFTYPTRDGYQTDKLGNLLLDYKDMINKCVTESLFPEQSSVPAVVQFSEYDVLYT